MAITTLYNKCLDGSKSALESLAVDEGISTEIQDVLNTYSIVIERELQRLQRSSADWAETCARIQIKMDLLFFSDPNTKQPELVREIPEMCSQLKAHVLQEHTRLQLRISELKEFPLSEERIGLYREDVKNDVPWVFNVTDLCRFSKHMSVTLDRSSLAFDRNIAVLLSFFQAHRKIINQHVTYIDILLKAIEKIENIFYAKLKERWNKQSADLDPPIARHRT